MLDIPFTSRLKHHIEQSGPKHWSFSTRKDTEYLAWVNEQTSDLPDDTVFPVRVYCADTGERPICPEGNTRKLKSILDGWQFCGPASRCPCARSSVSASVKQTKSKETAEQKATTQQKREATNLQRYGHVNTGQTDKAKAAHEAFYNDLDNIRNQLRKQVATMMERYGVENAAHLREAIDRKRETLLERHGVSNPMQSKSIAAKSLATRLKNGYAEEYYRRNYERLKTRLCNDYRMDLLVPFEQYEGVAKRPLLDLQCCDCSRVITWRLDYGHKPRCYDCNPPNISYKSAEELAVFNFVREKLHIDDLLSGDRSLIAPYEIDILSENHKVAIEYGGLYWHSELQRRTKSYHLMKLKKVSQQGFRLLTLFSDEWLNKPDIVKSKICHLFGRIEDRRYARKMQLAEIDAATASEFYDKSHIQGSTRASYHLGLIDAGEIVAVMSFTNARSSKGLPDNSYELVRFASLPYVAVVGGASKLFSHFVRRQNPTAIISYADRRWSDGGLYHRLGFQLEKTNPPSYAYVENYLRRIFRFNFRKDVLESILGKTEDATEWEIMRGLGYDRIWDCGSYRFVWRS